MGNLCNLIMNVTFLKTHLVHQVREMDRQHHIILRVKICADLLDGKFKLENI